MELIQEVRAPALTSVVPCSVVPSPAVLLTAALWPEIQQVLLQLVQAQAQILVPVRPRHRRRKHLQVVLWMEMKVVLLTALHSVLKVVLPAVLYSVLKEAQMAVLRLALREAQMAVPVLEGLASACHH